MLESKAKTPAEDSTAVDRVVARMLAPDHYGAVFCLIILALVLIGAAGDWVPARILVTAVLAINILYTMLISQTPRHWILATALLVLLATLLASLAAVTQRPHLATVAEAGLGALLVLVTPAIIARRLVQHVAVTLQTLAGALSIYLLLGIFFAYVYRFIAALSPTQLFAQTPHVHVADFLYFSFVTLTTLGYGDLTPALSLARMLAVTEALLGQLYLVTVVALLVGHATIERIRRGDEL